VDDAVGTIGRSMVGVAEAFPLSPGPPHAVSSIRIPSKVILSDGLSANRINYFPIHIHYFTICTQPLTISPKRGELSFDSIEPLFLFTNY
jgi:hypothetical protein